ncbi:hypothetical protein R3X27_01540 [Tropicimonas sp. TH_r6]|uniref:hypothetical protein n=1 Tax=Tropicimonas sp. TH_r6 TaxID=3082085 RepID=UPI002953445B|nr:hypothetical protein [Tropicimonas sp. TH_r6]MDV7141357.1 hypothetical protein [Tropicimonas sp. TH_r6]
MTELVNRPLPNPHGIIPRIIWPTLLVLLFSATFLVRTTKLSALSQLDELFLVGAFAIGLSLSLLHGRVHMLAAVYFAGLLCLTLLSSFGGLNPTLPISILSALLFWKLPLVAFAFRNAPLYDLSNVMRALFVFCVVGGAVSLSFPSFFISLLPDVSFKMNTERMVGFFLNANRQGALASLLFLYFWFVGRKKPLALLMLAILLLTGSRSYIAITPLIFLYFRHVSQHSLSTMLVAPVIATATLYLLITEFGILDTVQKATQTLDSGLRYIRVAILAGGFTLATEFFPLGAGGGMFASPLSHGSQAYVMLGIDGWATVIEGTGIHDSGIGTMLGEYGFLGTAMVFFLLFRMFRIWGQGLLSPVNCLFLLALVAYQSLFRQVISDFYFSFITIAFAILLYRLVEARRPLEKGDNANPT